MTQTLYFIRHGQTEWNAAMRMQGQLNSDLNELGRAQANKNGQMLRDHDLEALYVSPLSRTRETASLINAHLDLPVTFDDRLMEWHSGDWSGHYYAEIARKWPEEWAAWQADRLGYRPPSAENFADMIARARPFLAELRNTSYQRIGLVSHGLISRVMISVLLDLPDYVILNMDHPNDVVIRICMSDTPQVDHFNGGTGPIDGLCFKDPG